MCDDVIALKHTFPLCEICNTSHIQSTIENIQNVYAIPSKHSNRRLSL